MNWLPKRRVVVPLDFSDASFEALDTALQLVDAPQHVHVVHVLQELSPVEPGELWDTVTHETRTAHARKALRERLGADKYAGVEIDVLIGSAGPEIAGYAERVGAELIVMPSHGRTGLSRMLMGSVAERVVRLAHCPVLVLRNQFTD